ncbi:MAG: hypothetical protein JNL32_16030, partial [Candidatus Kapabacteria bacterium]|nr:hypothetical protein [Candidatus Kapabacteria bacterium]
SDDLSWSGDSRFVRSGNQVRDMRGTVTNMTPAQVDSIRWVGYGGIGSLPRQPFYVDGSDTLRSIYDNPNMPVRWISPSEYRTCNYTSIYSRRSSNSLIGNVTKIATPSSFTIYGAPHYSSTGDTLYGCGWDGSAYMVNHTGNVLRSFRIPSKKISHINSSHNFIFVSCGDSVCYLFSKRDTTRQDIVLFPGRETEAPNQLFIVSAFSVNNRYVAVNTASNNHSSTMTVYDTRVNQPCYMVQYNDDAIHSRMLFNKTSSYIAFRATRTSIRVVSLQDTSVSWLLSHSGQVLGYHWHPTGKAILTGSLDSTLVIWNPDNGSIIKAIRTPHPVYVVHWNHNGSQILYSTNDSTFILDLQSGLIIDRTHGVMNIASDNVLSPNEDRVVLLDGVTYLTWYIYFTSERRTVWHLGSPYVSGSADSTTIPLSVADSIVSVFDDVERNTHHQSITYSNNMLYLNDNTDAVSSVSIYSLHGALIRRISGDELAPHIPLDFLPSGMYALCAEGKGKATSIPLAIIR